MSSSKPKIYVVYQDERWMTVKLIVKPKLKFTMEIV